MVSGLSMDLLLGALRWQCLRWFQPYLPRSIYHSRRQHGSVKVALEGFAEVFRKGGVADVPRMIEGADLRLLISLANR